jgi:hypothetical protein
MQSQTLCSGCNDFGKLNPVRILYSFGTFAGLSSWNWRRSQVLRRRCSTCR